MELRFLGQPYSTANNSIETIPTEHTARFLGRTYAVRRPVHTVNFPSGISKKYRGVAY